MIMSYMNSYVMNSYMNSYIMNSYTLWHEFIYKFMKLMYSYDFFIYEFICFMNSYMISGVPRFQMDNSFECSYDAYLCSFAVAAEPQLRNGFDSELTVTCQWLCKPQSFQEELLGSYWMKLVKALFIGSTLATRRLSQSKMLS